MQLEIDEESIMFIILWIFLSVMAIGGLIFAMAALYLAIRKSENF